MDGKYVCPKCGDKINNWAIFQIHLKRRDHKGTDIVVRDDYETKFDNISENSDIEMDPSSFLETDLVTAEEQSEEMEDDFDPSNVLETDLEIKKEPLEADDSLF